VTESANPRFVPGDKVVVNGFGLGTDRDGGLAQRTRVPGAWLMPIPRGLSEWHAAAIGTAGYTAALAIDAMIDAGVRPESGPILVTGAGGGVGTISTILLSAAGFDVVASTGRGDELAASLERLGATEVIGRLTVSSEIGLASMRWAGVIDSVGSSTLAAAIASTRYSGVVAAVGLAGGIDLPTTVLPFLLRGIGLLGIDSVYASTERRQRAWDRLSVIDQDLLASIVTVVGLEDAWRVSQDVVAGRVHGRVVVDVNR
jgi:acrylyl-CoA reductase (NADPH)